jgi:hypothetical protein
MEATLFDLVVGAIAIVSLAFNFFPLYNFGNRYPIWEVFVYKQYAWNIFRKLQLYTTKLFKLYTNSN